MPGAVIRCGFVALELDVFVGAGAQARAAIDGIRPVLRGDM
jgi:hypothetical protein